MSLPPCGLYRTTRDLPQHEQQYPAGRLVQFHNHSEQGQPLLLLPEQNIHNRWRFASRGVLVDAADYLASLEPLPAEGWYRLREHFHPRVGQLVERGQLVQLGYTAKGEPIVFFPSVSQLANALEFGQQGLKIDQRLLATLEPLSVRGPIASGDAGKLPH